MKLTRRNIIIGAVVVVVAIAIFAISRNGKEDGEVVEVQKRDLVENVQIIGDLATKIDAGLGFDVSGRVQSIVATENTYVSQGDILVRLDLGTLPAELSAAQADLAIKRAESGNASITLGSVTNKQDSLVESAYATLLSEGLVAEPSNDNYTQTPPSISGRYVGDEGRYKISIDRGVQKTQTLMTVSGLEVVVNTKLSDTSQTPLGTRGLFVDFADDLNSYADTTWYVNIPNTKSSSYIDNFNAYQEALSERDRAIEEARNQLRDAESESSIAAFEIQRAEAEVAKIQSEISDRILRAPFDGFVVSIDVDPGESVVADETLVTLISDDLGVEIDLPEVDRVKVQEGDLAEIVIETLDNKKFSGVLSSVNRAETEVDGVSVYEARVTFDEITDDLASGMAAEVTIFTDRRDEVLSLPMRAVLFNKDGARYVVLDENGRKSEVTVTTGLESTDGFVEILSGLSEGQKVFIES